MLLSPTQFHPPLAPFSAFVLALFAFKLTKMLVLYRSRVRTGIRQSLGAAVAGLSLVYTIGRAVIVGLLGVDARFFRTPKLAQAHTVRGALAAAAPEAGLALALLFAAFGVAGATGFESIDRDLWALLLTVFALPHLAAVLLSLSSALPAGPARRLARILGPYPAVDRRS